MWSFVQLTIVIVAIIVSITEFFYPLIAGKPFFGSFRKIKRKDKEETNEFKKESNNSSQSK
jgi:hypothetical protein